VSQHVRVQLFAVERRAPFFCGGGVGADALLDCVAAEPAAGAGGEQRVCCPAGSLGEPGRQDRLGGGGERNGALLSAFAFAADMRAGAERDVAAVQADEL